MSTESKENGSVPENISGSDDSLDVDNHSLMCVDVSEIPEPITTSESLEPHSQIPEPSDTSHTDVTEVIPVSLANVGLSEDGVTSGSPPTLSTGICGKNYVYHCRLKKVSYSLVGCSC